MKNKFLTIEDAHEDSVDFKAYDNFIQVSCGEPVNINAEDAEKLRDYLDYFLSRQK